MRPRRRQLLAAAATATTAMAIDVTGTGVARAATAADPVPVPLATLYDNNGIGVSAGDADLDGSGYGFPAGELPEGTVTVAGVPYELATTGGAGQNDNVVALGQAVTVPAGRYVTGYLLATSTYGSAAGVATVHYADGSTSTATVSAPDWYAGGAGAVSAPYRYSPGGTDQHPVALYAVSVWLDPARTATSISLPDTAVPAPGTASLHVFALSLQPVVSGSAVRLTGAAGTTGQIRYAPGRWAQVVRATVLNVGSEWITSRHPLTVSVSGPGVRTVVPAVIRTLAPGEQARVEVGILSPTLPAGTPVDGTVRVAGTGVSASTDLSLSAGIPAFQATDVSLAQHQPPDWFSNAKFGIFVHWGVYSVPAWAPVGLEYAEWYWQHLDNPNDPTYAYHAQTYGQQFNYDDFIPMFTAARFDPEAWVRLFQQAGARYFVLTAKHHEGFCLFDTAYTDRNSVNLGPHRDLVGELFQAARTVAPHLHRGLYYSLPEWYNPALPWQGHPARNPYTGQAVPYTGDRPVADYQRDLQVPQLKELITKYRPEVLWGDIGYPATDRSVLQLYFNQGLATGDQVTVDNRMGLPDYDFTTPEYASSFALQPTKFEASRGIDPRSYGYNAATPDSAYATAEQLVRQLVDIVSKNGNLLLDIGPRADGTIPEVMQTRLREIGGWLAVNGEAIYDTTYWANGAVDGDLRFTIRPDEAFYLLSLTEPGTTVTTGMPVPIRAGDQVTMLGYRGGRLHWTRSTSGGLTIEVPDAARRSGRYVWVFKVTWRRMG
ncbi:MAG: alpha-L-fucosidase [Micromonosporaceae bacterium]